MFSSAILDVVIGLVFCFLTVSLMASAVVEAISSTMRWRSTHLLEGIKQLVNDPGFDGLALRLYQHAAVNPRGLPVRGPAAAPSDGTSGTKTPQSEHNGGDQSKIDKPQGGTDDPEVREPDAAASDADIQVSGFKNVVGKVVTSTIQGSIHRIVFKARSPALGSRVDLASMPAYIDGKQFASALMDILKLSDSAAATDAVAAAKKALGDALEPGGDRPLPIQADPQLHLLLTGIVQRCQGDILKIQEEIGAWFDNGMDRLSGAYKRRTQAVSFLVALLLSILVNVDAIRVVHVLWSHPELAADLKAPEAVAKSFAELHTHAGPAAASHVPDQPPSTPAPVTTGVSHDAPAASELLAVLDDHLPVGWAGLESAITSSNFWSKLLGWLITAVAALFGAPFWFDTLQAVTRLKGTGPSPGDKVADRAAAN